MTRTLVAVTVGTLLLASCSTPEVSDSTPPAKATDTSQETAGDETGDEGAPADDAAETPSEEERTETTEPLDEQPTEEAVETNHVGDEIERPSANLIVNVIEQRESIPAPNAAGFYDDGYIKPGDGERLWYIDITWTNNLPEAVAKECHGPYSMALSAYDLQGREMMMVEQPGMIEGQECSTGLMQGQTGTWLSAFHGLDEDFGWLVFDDYNGEPAIVTLDPDLVLHRD